MVLRKHPLFNYPGLPSWPQSGDLQAAWKISTHDDVKLGALILAWHQSKLNYQS
jgi:hypothetical protein